MNIVNIPFKIFTLNIWTTICSFRSSSSVSTMLAIQSTPLRRLNTHGRFSDIYFKEITFVTSCLPSCTYKVLYEKESTLKAKNLLLFRKGCNTI